MRIVLTFDRPSSRRLTSAKRMVEKPTGTRKKTSQNTIPSSCTNAAIARGVFGAPFYFFRNEGFWGQDRLEYLDRSIAKALRADQLRVAS